MWIDLGDFAKNLAEITDSNYLELSYYIQMYIDWDKVWEGMSDCFSVYDNYVFTIM
jgi:hypothetical protein